jgi:DNA polymerase-4
MLELCQDIGHKLRIHELKASGVQISIRNNELLFKQYQGQLSYATQNPMDLALKASALFHQHYNWQTHVRAVTVRAINLRPKSEPQQIMLFEDVSKLDQKEQLFKAVEDIRRRFGKRAIYPAVLMGDIKMPEYRDHALTLPGAMNR